VRKVAIDEMMSVNPGGSEMLQEDSLAEEKRIVKEMVDGYFRSPSSALKNHEIVTLAQELPPSGVAFGRV
jgi:hypothetical protein